MNNDEFEIAVAALDKKFPDWWKNIDILSLDMERHYRCILGQLLPSRYIANEYRQLEKQLVGRNHYEVFGSNAYRRSWINLIEERRQAEKNPCTEIELGPVETRSIRGHSPRLKFPLIISFDGKFKKITCIEEIPNSVAFTIVEIA